MSIAEPDREFCKLITISGLPLQGRIVDLAPSEAERAAIARRLDIPAVETLSGRVEIRPAQGGIALNGRIQASLVRLCVVTLEPVNETVDERFDLRFARGHAAEAQTELLIDEDTPEPLEGEEIDIGEVLVQQLALAMDPYPRRDGAVVEKAEFGQTLDTSPFAVLKGAIAERRDEE